MSVVINVDDGLARRLQTAAESQNTSLEELAITILNGAVQKGNVDSVKQWTDGKSRRRAELVDRQIAGTLTGRERAELDSLQQQMRAYREKVAPLPLEDTRQLHSELMEKARRARKA